MTFLSNKCIGCDGSNLCAINNRTICNDCGLQFDIQEKGLNYSQTYSEAESLYADHFQSIDHYQTLPIQQLHASLLPFESRLSDFIGQHASYASLVDLGCGIGRFLRAGEDLLQNARGYEMAEILVGRLKQHGRKISLGGIKEFIQGPERPDVVTLLEVIEHLREPGQSIREILEVKSPKALAVVVPNSAVRRKYDRLFAQHDEPPNHLSWWNSQSLIAALSFPGYEIQVESIPEKRKELFRYLHRDRGLGGTSLSWFCWIKAFLNPPHFWLLAIAKKHEK